VLVKLVLLRRSMIRRVRFSGNEHRPRQIGGDFGNAFDVLGCIPQAARGQDELLFLAGTERL
jgi:hypothetical protein